MTASLAKVTKDNRWYSSSGTFIGTGRGAKKAFLGGKELFRITPSWLCQGFSSAVWQIEASHRAATSLTALIAPTGSLELWRRAWTRQTAFTSDQLPSFAYPFFYWLITRWIHELNIPHGLPAYLLGTNICKSFEKKKKRKRGWCVIKRPPVSCAGPSRVRKEEIGLALPRGIAVKLDCY